MKKIIIGILGMAILVFGIYKYSYVDRLQYLYDKELESSSYETESLLWHENVIEQSFVCQKDGFCEFRFRVGTYGRENKGNLDYVIFEESKTIRQGTIKMSDMQDGSYCSVSFNPIENSGGKSYLIQLSSSDINAENGIAVYKCRPSNDNQSSLTVNGEPDDNNMVIRIVTHGFDIETFIVMLFAVVYLLAFVKVMFVLFK